MFRILALIPIWNSFVNIGGKKLSYFGYRKSPKVLSRTQARLEYLISHILALTSYAISEEKYR